MHILGLGQRIKRSLVSSGIIGYQFGTVGVSGRNQHGYIGDVVQPSVARSHRRPSRDGRGGDIGSTGMVVVPGCDKNMPGVLMARESLMLFLSPVLFTECSWTIESTWFHGVRWNYTAWVV